MFDADPFAKRERAMEDEFFHRVDEKLRENLRQEMEREQARESIAAATGIDDAKLLDALLDAGIGSETLVALTLIPSVFVAWADGNVTDAERDAVMKAASERGIDSGHVAYEVLQGWLGKRPPKSLWATWKQYAEIAGKTLDNQTRRRFAEEIVKHATWVAKASGGILGIGKISAAEQAILDDVSTALG